MTTCNYLCKCKCVVRFCLSPIVPRKRQSKEQVEYEETPQEKKLRLAKLYLEQLKEEGKLFIALYK